MDELDHYVVQTAIRAFDNKPHEEEEVKGDGLPYYQDRMLLGVAMEEYEKAFRKPEFLRKMIFERDRPIHERWCSTKEAAWVVEKVEEYLTKEVKGVKGDPYELYEHISVVYPTVDTIDLFNMLNSLPSVKTEDTHWTGHAEQWSKMWSELDTRFFLMEYGARDFLKGFDHTDDVLSLIEIIKRDNDYDDENFTEYSEHMKKSLYKTWYSAIEDSVNTMDDDNFKSDVRLVMSYRTALGLVPHEPAQRKKRKNMPWLAAKRDIPSPYSILILRDMRDKTYMCWNFKIP